MKRPSCLLIILDGCREDYIDRELTPFLNKLKNKGSYTSLDVTSSFYTVAEISTGNSPITTDTSFDFCFDPANSPFKFFRYMKLPLSLRYGNIRRERFIRNLMCKIYSIVTHNWVDFPPNIPITILPYFNVNQSLIRFQKAEREESRETLFGIFRENGFDFQSISGYAPSIQKQMVERPYGEKHVLMLHYIELDKIGHQYGPNSEEVKVSLRDIDYSIGEVYRDLGEQVDFIMVFGDHNMEEIEAHIDMWEELKKLNVKIPEDYLVFLNSPVARFWFNNDKARREVKKLLGSLKQYGRVISKKELEERRLPSNEKYGEVIFWLKKGAAIVPDFYHEYPVKGMHFFFDSAASAPLMLLHEGKTVKLRKDGKLIDVMPTILDLLDIQDNQKRDGRSLVIRE